MSDPQENKKSGLSKVLTFFKKQLTTISVTSVLAFLTFLGFDKIAQEKVGKVMKSHQYCGDNKEGTYIKGKINIISKNFSPDEKQDLTIKILKDNEKDEVCGKEKIKISPEKLFTIHLNPKLCDENSNIKADLDYISETHTVLTTKTHPCDKNFEITIKSI